MDHNFKKSLKNLLISIISGFQTAWCGAYICLISWIDFSCFVKIELCTMYLPFSCIPRESSIKPINRSSHIFSMLYVMPCGLLRSYIFLTFLSRLIIMKRRNTCQFTLSQHLLIWFMDWPSLTYLIFKKIKPRN